MATPLRRNRVGLKAFWRPTAPWRQLLEATAAATIAWVIALRIFEHPDPFFAPIAAVVSLNATVGERGRETVRLLLGVIIGISIGEVTVAVMASSALPLALATLAAMATARLLGGGRMVIVQAASGAILTVASANGAGYNRLLDALLGGGVALVFTQLLFTPDPIRLLRRAESAVLDEMADALDVTARGLAHDRDDLAEEAMQNLRGLRDRLSELARTRDASGQVARQSAAWRAQRIPLVQETEDAGHLDLLGGSCLMLTRTAFAVTAAERRALVPTVEHLATALANLADDPGDRGNRQR
ncbi:MAG: FUSC family protein, partial [Gaiellales bacterium]